MQSMLSSWLLVILTGAVVVAQGLALLLLARFLRVADKQAGSVSATFQAHMERVEGQARISNERFRVISSSLDELMKMCRSKAIPYPITHPRLQEAEARDELETEVRAHSNHVASYAELRKLAKEQA